MRCVWEHNGDDTLLYAVDYIGAFTRGETLEVASDKMPAEIDAYVRWSGQTKQSDATVVIVQEQSSSLHISDADSDVLFDTEREPLTLQEYRARKSLVLKSANDFHTLYASVPEKDKTCLNRRKTFYGEIPRTAQEMYQHTRQVNAYYWGEIGVNADNDGTIYTCRKRAFEQLEKNPDYLANPVVEGSYQELWSLRKVLRRFLWHDRIHAKALYRMAVKTFGAEYILNPFYF